VIWVEVLSRHRDVLARHRIPEGEIRVGRGYENEIVVDDPHVAPAHLLIARDAEGRLVAEDLGSLNGLYVDGGRERFSRVVLDGEGTIRIGQTWLRVREAGHLVEPERPLVAERWLWPWAIPLLVAIFGIECTDVWLSATRPLEFARFVDAVTVVGREGAAWIALWVILSRIFSGAARVERHLVLALSALLAYSLYDEVTSLLAFGLSWPGLVTWRFVVYWIAIGAAAFGQMRIIGPTRLRLKAAGAAAIAVAGIGVQLNAQLDLRDNMDAPDPIHRFYPPSFRLAPAQPADRFLEDLDGLRRRLDGGRADDRG
jgi:hypothetical protein